MKKTIELTIEYIDHTTTELTNEAGDVFTFNPLVQEGLDAFLSEAKQKELLG